MTKIKSFLVLMPKRVPSAYAEGCKVVSNVIREKKVEAVSFVTPLMR